LYSSAVPLPPLAKDDDFTTSVGVPVSGNVLIDNGNGADEEPDNQAITVITTPVTGPTSGTVVLNTDGTFTYTPNAGFFGVDTFEYEITDPSGLASTAIVTITIVPPSLTIVKQVINDGAGTSGVGAFGITTSGSASVTFGIGVVSGTTITYTSDAIELIPGTYTLIESDIADYNEGAWSCTGAAGTVLTAFDGGSVEIANGEDVVCTIINDDIPVTDLAIEKTVDDINPEIGDVVEFTLLVTNNGPEDATAVEIDDALLTGFTFVAGSMTGGDTQNQSAPNLQWIINNLANGASVSLTYEATIVAP